MKLFIGGIVGLVIGLLITRLFWFTSLDIQFTGIILGSGLLPPLDFLIETGAFKKSLIGSIVGGITGLLLIHFVSLKSNQIK